MRTSCINETLTSPVIYRWYPRMFITIYKTWERNRRRWTEKLGRINCSTLVRFRWEDQIIELESILYPILGDLLLQCVHKLEKLVFCYDGHYATAPPARNKIPDVSTSNFRVCLVNLPRGVFVTRNDRSRVIYFEIGFVQRDHNELNKYRVFGFGTTEDDWVLWQTCVKYFWCVRIFRNFTVECTIYWITLRPAIFDKNNWHRGWKIVIIKLG